MSSRRAVASTQVSSPNGVPRLALQRSDFNFFSPVTFSPVDYLTSMVVDGVAPGEDSLSDSTSCLKSSRPCSGSRKLSLFR
jgi:hypothetical protein